MAQIPMWDHTEEKCAAPSRSFADRPPPFTRPALTPPPGLPHSIIEEMRRFMEFPFDVPHEAFARQHAENPEAFVVQPHHRAQLPPGFWSHEVVFATQNIF